MTTTDSRPLDTAAPPGPVARSDGLVGSRPPRLRREPLPSAPALFVWFVGAVSLLALWGVVYPVFVGAVQEQRSQTQLYAAFREKLALATAPIGPTGIGDPVALLDAPRIDLRHVVVVEGTSAHDLQAGPGHRRDTVMPGQQGTAVLFGKGATYGRPFSSITRLRTGDELTTTTGQGVFHYRVERVRHAGDPNPVPVTEGHGRLILATSEGGFAPTGTVYVDALLVEPAQPSPGGRPRLLPDAEQKPMGRSTGALLPVVFWLFGLLLVVVIALQASVKWGRAQTWLVATPVGLALAVGASGAVTQLLPNLL